MSNATKKLLEELSLSVAFIFGNKVQNSNEKSYGDWDSRSYDEIKKILNYDGEVDALKISRFLRDGVYVSDSPSTTIKGYSGRNDFFDFFIRLLTIFTGFKRNGVNEAKLTFSIIESLGMLSELNTYPMSAVGRPFPVKYKGYEFTNRYLRHIYFLTVFKENILEKLPESPIIMDIGSSYGVFSSLVKKSIPRSHHILVELPGQLILAHYYLQTEFPEATIATIEKVDELVTLDTETIRQYDFVLLSTTMYHKLESLDIDVVTNFVSLAEMSKDWFDTYLQSQPFISAKYFFTANRYDSYPTYSNGITIMDYPLNNYKKIIFKTLPILKSYFLPSFLFFTKKVRFSSELFLFIGKQ